MVVVREEGRWRCDALDERALESLDTTIRELRRIGSSGAILALLGVDDDFFVIVRPAPSGVELLLSDASAAQDYDIAADVMEMLDAPIPDDDDEMWAEGDSHILADLGLPAEELEMIAADEDLYPDEQLRIIARRCGFIDEFDRSLGRLV